MRGAATQGRSSTSSATVTSSGPALDSRKKLRGILSKSREINALSAARFFLFGSRDIWFVVGVPVFLSVQLQWGFTQVGGFLAWVIGYGVVQSLAPAVIGRFTDGRAPQRRFLSYLILAYSDGDEVALDVGFYYMANAGGRLVGTLLSGLIYQLGGLAACLWTSMAFAPVTGLLSWSLPAAGTAPLMSAVKVQGGD